jgi:hypothetical protein
VLARAGSPALMVTVLMAGSSSGCWSDW